MNEIRLTIGALGATNHDNDINMNLSVHSSPQHEEHKEFNSYNCSDSEPEIEDVDMP